MLLQFLLSDSLEKRKEAEYPWNPVETVSSSFLSSFQALVFFQRLPTPVWVALLKPVLPGWARSFLFNKWDFPEEVWDQDEGS